MRHYLLSIAVLGRFCAPLCGALCGPDVEPGQVEIDGWNFINLLKKDNLFVVNLDAGNRWLRYHHLFQQLLENQLKRDRSPEEIATLHSRASAWFAENGLIEEALQHAIAADDLPYAVKLTEQHRHDLMNKDQQYRLDRWLQLLPPEMIEKNPALSITRAWSYEYRTQADELWKYLDQAEDLVSATSSESAETKGIRGEIDALRCLQHYVMAEADRAVVRGSEP